MKYRCSHAFFARILVIGISLAFLSGCVMAPGMYLDDSSASFEPEAQGAPGAKPVIKNITPQLIQQEQQLAKTGNHAELSGLMTSPQPYTIGPGDFLAITVWDHPELVMPTISMSGTSTMGVMAAMGVLPAGTLPPGYTVSSEGKIQFPYAGDFKVEGLTELQARDLLIDRLSHYIKKPEVTLRVFGFRSKRVYVDGEVKLPGIVQIDDIPPSLPEALNRAGGVTAFGDQSHITVTREGKTYPIDLPALIADGINPSRIMLSSGDLLRVPPLDESRVFVIGEVVKPTTLTLHNGRLSLNEALGQAGGVNPQTADANQVYVIRNANDEHPIIYHLDAHSPVTFALAEGFELKAKDVVYVDATSLVRYNRVISLILPTAQTVYFTKYGIK